MSYIQDIINQEYLFLGEDVPMNIMGYNEDKLNAMSFIDALCLGHVMWELTRSGILEDGQKSFNGDEDVEDYLPGYSNIDGCFGKILVYCNKKSGCFTPDQYEDKFNKELKEGNIPNHLRVMLANCFGKVALAMAGKYKLKFKNK